MWFYKSAILCKISILLEEIGFKTFLKILNESRAILRISNHHLYKNIILTCERYAVSFQLSSFRNTFTRLNPNEK